MPKMQTCITRFFKPPHQSAPSCNSNETLRRDERRAREHQARQQRHRQKYPYLPERKKSLDQFIRRLRHKLSNHKLKRYGMFSIQWPRSPHQINYALVIDGDTEYPASHIRAYNIFSLELLGELIVKDSFAPSEDISTCTTYTPVLDYIWVTPSCQRKGIGSNMLRLANQLTQKKLMIDGTSEHDDCRGNYITDACACLLRKCIRDHVLKDDQVLTHNTSTSLRLTGMA